MAARTRGDRFATFDRRRRADPVRAALAARLRTACEALGPTFVKFGQLLGFTGENRNIYSTVKRYEEGRRDISPTVERLVLMLGWFKEDFGYLPDLDRGERVPEKMPAEFTA